RGQSPPPRGGGAGGVPRRARRARRSQLRDPVRGRRMRKRFLPPAGDEPWTHFVDPTLDRVRAQRRWGPRAAQWRARALGEVVFGGDVEARLAGQGGGAFRGLLHLDVPFEDLDRHREREALFLAAAGRDPVLAGVPFVYVFGARRTR